MPEPYRVWVSEIMLQQTRVAAVLEHYARLMARFPTVQSLAAAREQSVLAMWSGLGYYHRARRLHQAAKVIARERNGEFPETAETWRELPGIGRYTASAIASIAFRRTCRGRRWQRGASTPTSVWPVSKREGNPGSAPKRCSIAPALATSIRR